MSPGSCLGMCVEVAGWDKTLNSHVLTHAHPDHQGCSHTICERFEVPLFCGEGDREAQETGRFERTGHR